MMSGIRLAVTVLVTVAVGCIGTLIYVYRDELVGRSVMRVGPRSGM